MKTTPMLPTPDTHVAEERLTPIRIWAHANHGAVQRITDRLALKTGRPIQRQTVGRWLHKDPGKRQQPGYGFGILLEEAAREIQQEMREEQIAELKRERQGERQARTTSPRQPKAAKPAKKAKTKQKK